MTDPITAWQEALAAAVGRWRQGSAPLAPSPGAGERAAPLAAAAVPAAPEWLPAAELQRLADQPPELRAPLLELARRRLASFPYARVHPGWLVAALPADPLLRQWCVALLPPPVRERLVPLLPRARGTGAVRVDPVGPPRWLAAWWRGDLAARLDYPHPLPWSLRPEQPLTWLWRLSDAEALALLRRTGLRLVASAVSRLPHAEVVQWVYRFPPEQRDALIALVRDRRFPETEGWSARLAALAESSAPIEVPLHLCLLDVAAQAHARGLAADATRLAYRLPPDLGRELLDALRSAAADPELAALAAPAPGWDAFVREDLDALVAAGLVAAPDLAEEAA
jgi:hypothetical protein